MQLQQLNAQFCKPTTSGNNATILQAESHTTKGRKANQSKKNTNTVFFLPIGGLCSKQVKDLINVKTMCLSGRSRSGQYMNCPNILGLVRVGLRILGLILGLLLFHKLTQVFLRFGQ